MPRVELASNDPSSVARPRAGEHALTGHGLAHHRAESADRWALARALRRLQQTAGFAVRPAAVRRQAEAGTRTALMDRCWAQHRSAEWVLLHGELPAEGVAAVGGLQATAAPAFVARLVALAVAVAVVAPAGAASGAAPAPLRTSLSARARARRRRCCCRAVAARPARRRGGRGGRYVY
ncbi:MAG: hypothetical protein M1826_005243 [Phylliscum demangeonii]|nr:MAG: hypothetical protein M1826_005243 [Phylliscum demangeonii]